MRRRRPERREILPDPVYNDLEVAKFVNYIMSRGKKGIAEKIFYGAMKTIEQRTKPDARQFRFVALHLQQHKILLLIHPEHVAIVLLQQ